MTLAISMLSRISSTCILKCKHMTLTTYIMVNHIIPLHAKNAKLSLNIPHLCCFKCYNINIYIYIYSLDKVACVDKWNHIGNRWV